MQGAPGEQPPLNLDLRGSVQHDANHGAPSLADLTSYVEPQLEGIEDFTKYRPGGYHPILLNDTFKNGRYRILHKLGYGGYSTVWLARDAQANRYVALKILCAQVSNQCPELEILGPLQEKESRHPGRKHIAWVLDSFSFDGPNGSHLCLVFEALGPTLLQLQQLGLRLRGSVARKIGLELTQALAYLHSEDICHGDVTTMNIALALRNFDRWTEEELFARMHRPTVTAVKRASGEPCPPSMPAYLVQTMEYSDVVEQMLLDEIRLIDFGVAFHPNDPPHDPGTPPSFTAPEIWFEMAAGKPSDLWALGCTLYEMRASDPLFLMMLGGTAEEAISRMSEVLGQLPERWCRLCFNGNGVPQKLEDGEESPWCEPDGRLVKTFPLIECVQSIDEFYETCGSPLGPQAATPDPKVSKLHDISTGVPAEERPEGVDTLKLTNLPISSCSKTYCLRAAKRGTACEQLHSQRKKISPAEAECFHNLLAQLVLWEPNKRSSAEELLTHPWFSISAPEPEPVEGGPYLFQASIFLPE